MSPEADGTNRELELLRRENARLRKMLGQTVAASKAEDRPGLKGPLLFSVEALPSVTNHSTVQEKVGLFRSLFKGREDVLQAMAREGQTTLDFSTVVKGARLPANKVAYLLNRLHEKDCIRKVARGQYRLFHGLFKEYLKQLR